MIPARKHSDLSAWDHLRDGGRPLAALLCLAALVKLLCVAGALSDNPLARVATSDSLYYLERAAGLRDAAADPLAAEPFHMPPLYPWVLAAVPGALEQRFGGVMLLQALGGVALLAAVYVLARRRLSRAAAWTATALTLLYGPLTFFETKILGDSLAAALLTGWLLLADGLVTRPGATRGFVAGLLAGVIALLRPQALLLVPVVAACLLARRGTSSSASRTASPGPPSHGHADPRAPVDASRRAPVGALAMLIGAALALAPATWHNLRAGGGFVLVSDNGGVNLWLANTGPPSGTFVTHDAAFGDIAQQATSARRVAESAAGRTLTAAEISSWFTGRALEAILADPGPFATRVGLRARALVEDFETGIVTSPEVEGRLVPPLVVLPLSFGALLALAGASLALGWPRGAQRQPVLPLLAVTLMVAGTALVFFHYSRFRLPLIPILALCAAGLVDRVRERPRWPRIVAAVCVAAALGWISTRDGSHHAGSLANGHTSVAEARLVLSADAATLQQARADVERALAADPGYARALLLAARIELLSLRFDASDAHLRRVEAMAPDVTGVLELRATLCLHPHPDNAHRDLARARVLLDDLAWRAATDPALGERLAFLESRWAAATGR